MTNSEQHMPIKKQLTFKHMKKIIIAIVFIVAIASLNACKSTSSSCSSVEKQEIKNNVNVSNDNLEVTT